MAIVAPTNIRLEKLACNHEPTTFEYLSACVTSLGALCVIIVIYRPGSQAVSSVFFEELTHLLKRLSTLQLVLTDDMNIRLDRPDDPHTLRFNDILTSFRLSLVQHAQQPTHNLGGISDIVVTKTDSQSPNVSVKDVGLSDHCLVQ